MEINIFPKIKAKPQLVHTSCGALQARSNQTQRAQNSPKPFKVLIKLKIQAKRPVIPPKNQLQ